jgi:hypothetical protein
LFPSDEETITMVGRVSRLFLSSVFLLFAAATAPAFAVSMDKSSSSKDACVVRIGADAIQISGYQPDFSHDKYCEEFPSTGKIILVFDLEAPSMRDLPIEVRIVKDPMVPLSENADLAALTEAYVAPKAYPSGTLSFEHDFRENGHFIGLVTLTQPNGEKKTAQFNFAVGQTFLHFVPLILGGFLIASMAFLYWKHSGKRPKAAA